MVDVARALMGVIMVTSYPILTFCGRLEVYSIVPRLSLSVSNFFMHTRFAHEIRVYDKVRKGEGERL